MRLAIPIVVAFPALLLAGLLHVDAADAPWRVTLKDQVRTDLPALSHHGKTWSWSYERDLKADPADWLDRDTSSHRMRWKSFEAEADIHRNGLYGSYMGWEMEFPCSVIALAVSVVVANFADSVVRQAAIEYSLDGQDYASLAEASYGADRTTISGSLQFGEPDISRVWVRVRQAAGDANALQSGDVVFQQVSIAASGPARALSEREVQAARERIAQRRARRLEREAELLHSAGLQAEAVAAYNEALLTDIAVKRARYYVTGELPDGRRSGRVSALERRLAALEERFLDLYHASFGPTSAPRGNRTPVEPSAIAKRLAADPQALEDAHQGYMAALADLSERAQAVREAQCRPLASLRGRALRPGYAPEGSAPTPTFTPKPAAVLRPDGTATGLLFGLPHESRSVPGIAALEVDYIAGTFDKYHTDYAVSPLADAQARSLMSQVIVPCAVHGKMWCDIPWFDGRKGDAGLVRPEARGQQWIGQWLWGLDFHHPDVRKMLEGYLRTVGERYRADERVLLYTTAWEAMRNDGHSGEWGKWETGGRTPAAIRDFRAYLQAKLGSVEKLNEAWRTSYASFDEIDPPVDVHHGPAQETAGLQGALAAGNCPPLYYEFNRFLLDSYADYLAWAYRTLKEIDPTTPVSVSPSYGALDGFLCVGRDSFRWAEKACDIYGSEFQSPMEEVFHYSIQRALGRSTGTFEHNFADPENWSNPTEDVFRAAAMRNLWRMVAWGRTVVSLFGWADTYGGTSHNNMAVFESGYNLLRLSGGVVGPVKRRLRSMEDVWLEAPIVAPRIAVLHSPTSRICAWPPEITTRACQGLHSVLQGAQYHYAFVHEDHLISGREDLSAFKVLVLPNSTHLPPGPTETILPWVRRGGVLVINGIAGGFTPYGQKDGSLMLAIFGDIGYQPWTIEGVLGRTGWMLGIHRLLPGARDVGSSPGKVLLAEYGRGWALLAPALEDLWPGGAAVPEMLALLGKAAPRDIWLEGDALELVVRSGRGHSFLTLINPSSNHAATTRVRLAKPPREALDRGIEGGFAVPVRSDATGAYFDLVLAPGEGTLIQLTP